MKKTVTRSTWFFSLLIWLVVASAPQPVHAAGTGDLNNDGVVNIFDALLALQYAVGLHVPHDVTAFTSAADVAPLDVCNNQKGDGTVNVFDALAILRRAVNLDDWICTTKPAPNVSVQILTDTPVFSVYQGGVSLAFDTADRPHLLIGGDHVYHYFQEGSLWRSERIPVPDMSNGTMFAARLFVDAQNVLHCLLQDPLLQMRYGTKQSGRWLVEKIDADAAFVDANGTLHTISYNQEANTFTYRTKSGGSWVTESFSAGIGAIGVTDGLATAAPLLMKLTVDAQGVAHLVFCRTVTDGIEDTILQYASNAGGSWSAETLREWFSTGPSAIDLVVDQGGTPHIAYGYSEIIHGTRMCMPGPCDNDDQVDYFTRVNGKWVMTMADGTDGPGVLSLNVGKQGAVHLMIQNYSLVYSAKTGSAWATTAVPEELHYVTAFSSALDSAGKLHLVHLYDGALRFASLVNEAWQIEPVANPKPSGEFQDLVTDMAGNLHVSYWDAANSTLMYATNKPGYWATEVVSSGVTIGRATAIAVDPHGTAQIASIDTNSGRLMHAVKGSGGWSVQTVSNNVSGLPSLGVDSNGNPYIMITGGLLYTRNTSGDWVVSQPIVLNNNFTSHAGISVTAAGKVYACMEIHYRSSGGLADGLWLASREPGASSWLTEKIPDGLANNSYCKVMADDAGTVHVAHKYWENQIMYARKSAGGWESQVVATGLFAGDIFLALDPARNPYLSYYDAANGVVNYAFTSGTGWRSNLLANIRNIYGKPNVMAPISLDPAGNLHAAIFDYNSGDLNIFNVSGPAGLP